MIATLTILALLATVSRPVQVPDCPGGSTYAAVHEILSDRGEVIRFAAVEGGELLLLYLDPAGGWTITVMERAPPFCTRIVAVGKRGQLLPPAPDGDSIRR